MGAGPTRKAHLRHAEALRRRGQARQAGAGARGWRLGVGGRRPGRPQQALRLGCAQRVCALAGRDG